MELARIRYFVTLCSERNFTRAARRCGVSQPSLSNGIKALERELGGKLFERSDMSLTPLGKILRLHFASAVASVGQIGFPSATVSSASRRGGPKSAAAGPRSLFERSEVSRRGDGEKPRTIGTAVKIRAIRQVPDIEKVTGKNAKRCDQIGGGKPGPGRKLGIPNKANGLLRDAIIQAAEEALREDRL